METPSDSRAWKRFLQACVDFRSILEENELPDDAAVCEVLKETSLRVEFMGDEREDVSDPVQLRRPAGVQLENIGSGRQHIDLIYLAKPTGPIGIH